MLSKDNALKVIICGSGEKLLEIKNLFMNSPNVLAGKINQYNAAALIKLLLPHLPYKQLHFQNSIPNKIVESWNIKLHYYYTIWRNIKIY